jgi:PEGA domain-containing protein
MKTNKSLLLALGLGLVLLLPAVPMQAQHHGSHGGGGRVFIGVGGWGWGWGWGWPGWYGYPGYYPDGPYYRSRGQWAVIKTDISPEEALVYLDGRLIGTADDFDGWPDNLYLGPGHYRIEFRLEGYQSISKEVDARPGVSLDFKDKLARAPGARHRGSYDTPKIDPIRRFFAKRRGADAQADPYMPSEPSTYVGDDNPPAPPNDGYPPSAAPAPRGQRDEYGEERRSSRDTRQARTRLRLTVEPTDAAVYVDDRFVGTAEEVNSLDRGVPLTPGKHTVTVSRPGFKDKTLEVTVEAGQTQTLEVRLGR